MSSIRVVVVDDQPLMRAGFRMILEAQPDIHVVGEAADGAEAVDVAQRAHLTWCSWTSGCPRWTALRRRVACPAAGADPDRRSICPRGRRRGRRVERDASATPGIPPTQGPRRATTRVRRSPATPDDPERWYVSARATGRSQASATWTGRRSRCGWVARPAVCMAEKSGEVGERRAGGGWHPGRLVDHAVEAHELVHHDRRHVRPVSGISVTGVDRRPKRTSSRMSARGTRLWVFWHIAGGIASAWDRRATTASSSY